MAEPTSIFGYPIKTAKELGLDEFFRTRPDVAGMAWGGGENGSPLMAPRSVVSNPYNPSQSNALQRAGLYMIEAARHSMSQDKYKPDFPLSQEQQAWRGQLVGPYQSNDSALKQSILSRILVGDAVPGITARQQVEADSLSKKLWKKDSESGHPLQQYLSALVGAGTSN